MSLYRVSDRTKIINDVIESISKKINNSNRDVYVINSTLGLESIDVKKNNIVYHICQFMPDQYNYQNMDKIMDGYITKSADTIIYTPYYGEIYYSIERNMELKVYYKQVPVG
jgi:hypothetical protein